MITKKEVIQYLMEEVEKLIPLKINSSLNIPLIVCGNLFKCFPGNNRILSQNIRTFSPES